MDNNFCDVLSHTIFVLVGPVGYPPLNRNLSPLLQKLAGQLSKLIKNYNVMPRGLFNFLTISILEFFVCCKSKLGYPLAVFKTFHFRIMTEIPNQIDPVS